MILENGVFRTLDPSLPVARALAIAGDRIAGGVGVHETALASPETFDLGGRCVLPGFTDSHVHFPTWAVAQREIRLDDVASLAEALERLRAAEVRGGWVRGYGWRNADWLIAANPILDFDFAGPHKGDRPAFVPSAKVARRVVEGLAAGFEYYSELGPFGRFAPRAEQQHTLFLAFDVDRGPWVFNFGVGRGLNGATDRWTVKAIFEIPL